MPIPVRSVRLRLTLWYKLALAFIVLAFSVSVFVFVKGRPFRRLDRQLAGEFSTIAGESAEAASELREWDPEGSSLFFEILRRG